MKTKMKMGVQVLVSDPEKLDAIRQRELDITKERIDKVLRAGANVVLTTQVLFGFIVFNVAASAVVGLSDKNVLFVTSLLIPQGIDDLCLKYFVEAGAMGVRRVTKEDMKRIAKATGATMALTLSNMEGEESFDPSMLGYGQFCFLIISLCFCWCSFRSL